MSRLDEANNTLPTIYTSLNSLVMNGIEIDKNLRQPNYYSCINSNELKSEVFGIITDLLTNQKVPCWLSQRIAWFYADRYLNQVINDLTNLTNVSHEIDSIDFVDSTEPKSYVRDKLVVYLRNSISKIIKEWQLKKSGLIKQNLLFSFARFEQDLTTNLKYSEFGIKNKRRIMEDKTAIIENIEMLQRSLSPNNSTLTINDRLNKNPSALFAVFDGHCGVDCAQYTSKHLPLYLIQHPELNTESDNRRAITESFQVINERFTQKAQKESIRSGSTCCLALLNDLALDVAWCGDTRFGLVKNGQLTFLTKEHKPDDENEKERIIKAGGNVSYVSNAWRIDSSLSVSRSFGDIDYQPSVIAVPEFEHFNLDGTEDYFIIGCDGLWDTLDLNELCSFVYEEATKSVEPGTDINIAEKLVRKAQSNGSLDNITAIFVLLKENLNLITKP